MRKKLLFLYLIILLFQTPFACANSIGNSTFMLSPASVLGSFINDNTSIEGNKLSRGANVDLSQALNNQLGIFNYSKGPIANDIVLNGLNRDNINVLVDGARIYGACPSRMDVPAFHIPLNFIQIVNITYGPYDVKHQGSMGGLIDVKTITPKMGFHSNISFNGNSYGFVNPNIESSYNNGKFYIVGGYSFKTAEPYKDAHGTKITDYISNEYKSTPSHDFNNNSYFTKIGFTPTTDSDISISYMKQNAEDVLYPFLTMDAIYDRSNIAVFKAIKDNITNTIKNLNFKLYYSNVYHLMSNQYRYGPYMATYATTQAYGGSFLLDLDSTTLGIDSYKRSWYADKTSMPITPKYIIPDVFITNIGFFAKKNFDITDNLKLDIGARVDTTESKPDTSLEESNNKKNPNYFENFQMLYGASATSSKRDTYPSGYVKFDYIVTQNNILFLGFGHGVRVPDPEERYIYNMSMNKLWIGNPNLNPTQNNEIDVGFNSNCKNLKTNFDVFYRYLKGYITLTQWIQNKNTYVLYQNTNAYMYGFNLGLIYVFLPNMTISSKTSYVNGYQDTDFLKHINSSTLPNVPPLREIISLEYDNQAYFIQLQAILASRQHNINTDLNEQKVPGYGLLNLKSGLKYKDIRLDIGINNVLNHEYYAYNDYYSNPFNNGAQLPEPGRFFYINASYNF